MTPRKPTTKPAEATPKPTEADYPDLASKVRSSAATGLPFALRNPDDTFTWYTAAITDAPGAEFLKTWAEGKNA